MRHVRADLTGRTALITGGRIKIGYQTVLADVFGPAVFVVGEVVRYREQLLGLVENHAKIDSTPPFRSREVVELSRNRTANLVGVTR